MPTIILPVLQYASSATYYDENGVMYALNSNNGNFTAILTPDNQQNRFCNFSSKTNTRSVDYSIDLPDYVSYGMQNYAVTIVDQFAFLGCSRLTRISMPAVLTINSLAFQNCQYLAIVSMPQVQTIGDIAFYGCDNIVDATMSTYFVDMVNRVFAYANNATVTVLNPNSIYFNTDRDSLVYKALTDGANGSAGTASVSYCSGYRSGSVTLNTVTHNKTSKSYIIVDIINNAFGGCSLLTSVSMPDVQTIGQTSFGGCSSLTSVTMSNSLASIGSFAFTNCPNIISVFFPGNYNSNFFNNNQFNGIKSGAIAYYLSINTTWNSATSLSGFTSKQSYSASDLKGIGYSASQLKGFGYSASALKTAEYNYAQLSDAGFTIINTSLQTDHISSGTIDILYGSGTLYINGNVTIINVYDFTGTITVSLGATATVSSGTIPTFSGSGTLCINGDVIIADASDSTGTIQVISGTAISGSSLTLYSSISNSDVTVQNGGSLIIQNSSMPQIANVKTVTLETGGSLDLTAGYLKTSGFTAGASSISMTAANKLAIDGNLTITGELTINVSGSVSSNTTYDIISYTGSQSGTITVIYNGTTPDIVVSGAFNGNVYRVVTKTFVAMSGNQIYVKQFGTTGSDRINAMTTGTDGSIYVGGYTTGSFSGYTLSGTQDAFIAKYNTSGTQIWLSQFGTTNSDQINAMKTGTDGSIYVGGYTLGSFSGYANSGSRDVFIAKYDTSGTQIWLRQFGTTGTDSIYVMTTGTDGSIYVGGATNGSFSGYTIIGGYDAFVAKYDTSGTQIWLRQFGTTGYDEINAMTTGTAGDGSIYVGGLTEGSFPGYTLSGTRDAFIAKYDTSGTQIWLRQFGTTAYDDIRAMTTGTDGSIYVGGVTEGSFSGYTVSGTVDSFVVKYDTLGNQIWVRQFGTTSYDFMYVMNTGADGSIYVGGYTGGTLLGQTKIGGDDVFIAKYDSIGTQVWVKQFGTTAGDYISAMTARSDGTIYVGGYTAGSFSGYTTSGSQDAFLAKYGYTAFELKSSGASAIDLYNEGYPVSQLINAGYTTIINTAQISTISGGTIDILYGSGNINVTGNVTITIVSDFTGTLTVSNGVTATVSSGTVATLSGSGIITVTGNVTITDASSFTGTIQVISGTATIGSFSSTSAIILAASLSSSATIAFSGNTVANNISVTGLGTNVVKNTSTMNVLSLSGTLTKNGTTLTLDGLIRVTGTIEGTTTGSDVIVNNNSVVTFTNANSYNGPTTINSGASLILDNSTIANSDVTVQNGGSLIIQNSSMPQTANIKTVTLAGGSLDLTAGYLRTNIFTTTSASSISMTAATKLAISGNLTIAETLTIHVSGQVTINTTYDMVTYTGSKLGAGTITLNYNNATTNVIVSGAFNGNVYRLMVVTKPFVNISGNQVYVKQSGTTLIDEIKAMTSGTDGSIYVGGSTTGSFPGYTSSGSNDAFVAKYNTSGTQVWLRQFGTTGSDQINAIATGTDGSIYVAGTTGGTFTGQTRVGSNDAFVAKYDTSGTQAWLRQFGTTNSDQINAMTTGTDGSIYVGGHTFGSFSGYTLIGSNDAFVAKYDTSGTQIWVKQFGTTASDYINAMTTGTDGSIYVGGYTNGIFTGQTSSGSNDAFVAKYDTSGTQVWLRQFGTTAADYINAMTKDLDGIIYLGGYTTGTFTGQTRVGSNDAFIAKYGSTVSERIDAGASLTDLYNEGYPASQLKPAGYSASDLKDAGYSASEIKDAGYSALEIKDAGYSVSVLKDVGYSASQLITGGYTLSAIQTGGYTLTELSNDNTTPASVNFYYRDTYGDGWNNGSVTIKETSTNATVITLTGPTIVTSSNPASKTWYYTTGSLNPYKNYTISKTNGSYPVEIYYAITLSSQTQYIDTSNNIGTSNSTTIGDTVVLSQQQLSTSTMNTFTAPSLGFTVAALLTTLGYTASQLYDAGYSYTELSDAGYTIADASQTATVSIGTIDILYGSSNINVTSNVTITAASSFTGTMQVTSGTATIGSLSSTSAIILAAGLSSSATIALPAGTVANNITVTGFGTNVVKNTSTINVLTLSGILTKNGTKLTLDGRIKVTGTIVGASTRSDIIVTDNSVVTFTNANSYNGPTTINSGASLTLDNSTIANSDVTVQNGGSLIIQNSSMPQIANVKTVTLETGGSLDLTAGYLKTSGFTTAGASSISMTAATRVAISVSLALTGTLSINLSGPVSIGTYDILTYAGSLLGSGTINLHYTGTTSNVSVSGQIVNSVYRVTVIPSIPNVPTITTTFTNNITNTTTPTIAISSVYQSTSIIVTFYDNDISIGNQAISPENLVGTTIQFTPTALAEGSHTITATAKYSGGAESAKSSPLTFTVDTIPPANPAITETTRQTVSGTAEANSTIVATNTKTNAVQTVTITADGKWSFTKPDTDAYKFQARDAANNISSGTSFGANYDFRYPKKSYILNRGDSVNIFPHVNGLYGGDKTMIFRISPALPAGLSLGKFTGKISGIPTESSPATKYTIFSSSSVYKSFRSAITINVQ